MKLMSTIHF